MSSLIDLLIECWMVDDTSLSNSDFIIPMVYLVLRLETPRIFYMNTPLSNTELIDLEVSNLT